MREIFIERREKLLRIAVRNDGKLIECFIEEDDDGVYPGQIYKGVVKNIVPAIKSAFIDIGKDKNAYLYLDSKTNSSQLKKGKELIVEVVKEELGGKGAKVTSSYSIPGRYTVLMTHNKEINFSSKISSGEFKEKVRNGIEKPENLGVMLRTNSEGVSLEDINNEIQKLLEIYNKVIQEGAYRTKPGLLYSDEGILDRVLRDTLDDSTGGIVVDNEEDYQHIKNYIKNKSDINVKPEFYTGYRTLFDYYGIEKEILSLRNNKVPLSCGGYLVIDRTEAMHVIDVNSGKNISQNAMERTAALTNLQAAEEIAVQVRLRNLSGIIVVDFIDLTDEAVKKDIIRTLQKGFEGDKNKTVIHPFTELNLVQIARRRRGRNIYDFMEEECRCCRGRGRKLKAAYVYNLIKNEILKVDSEDSIKNIYIEVNELYREAVSGDIISFVKEIGGLDKKVYLNFTKSVEYFKVEPLIFANQIQNVEQYKIYG